MKTWIWIALIIVVGMIACGKDKFQTIPQLTLRSKSPDVVPVNGTLRLNVEYTDKEGDVSDTVFIVRQRLNVRGPLLLPPSPYDIPEFPHTDKGEFEISLLYQRDLIFNITPPIRIPGSNPAKYEIDTLRLKVVAKDKAGNKSDTLVVDNVYVIR
jgi:hypothetical protein